MAAKIEQPQKQSKASEDKKPTFLEKVTGREFVVDFENQTLKQEYEFLKVDIGAHTKYEPKTILITPEEREKQYGASDAQMQSLLNNHGLPEIKATSFDVNFLYRAQNFSKKDWEVIAKSEHPVHMLWGMSQYYISSIENNIKYYRGGFNHPAGQDIPVETAEYAALPLVHTTNPKKLDMILSAGKILSDREYAAQLKKEGLDPTDQNYKTNTYYDDRKMGLDNYVFTFFGKPLAGEGYGNIDILLKPDPLMRDSGAFATKNDYMDLFAKNTEQSYRSEIIAGKYSIEVMAQSLLHSDHKESPEGYGGRQAFNYLSGETYDQYGRISSKPYEVKLPNATVDMIDAIVFRSPKDLIEFKKKYGEKYPTRLCNRDGLGEIKGWVINNCGKNVNESGIDEMFVEDRMNYEDREFSRIQKEEPEKLKALLGETKIGEPYEMYKLSDGDERENALLKAILARGSEQRIEDIDQIPDDKKTSIFTVIEYPKNAVTEGMDIFTAKGGVGFFKEKDTLTRVHQHSVDEKQSLLDDDGLASPRGKTRTKLVRSTFIEIVVPKEAADFIFESTWRDRDFDHRDSWMKKITPYKVIDAIEFSDTISKSKK